MKEANTRWRRNPADAARKKSRQMNRKNRKNDVRFGSEGGKETASAATAAPPPSPSPPLLLHSPEQNNTTFFCFRPPGCNSAGEQFGLKTRGA